MRNETYMCISRGATFIYERVQEIGESETGVKQSKTKYYIKDASFRYITSSRV